jgi:hypothetical protein
MPQFPYPEVCGIMHNEVRHSVQDKWLFCLLSPMPQTLGEGPCGNLPSTLLLCPQVTSTSVMTPDAPRQYHSPPCGGQGLVPNGAWPPS